MQGCLILEFLICNNAGIIITVTETIWVGEKQLIENKS